ncbi:MAG: hypothetical protein C0469_17405 [Cyanobacteria bacterium DS2.3.42]|nr:hypothetical protein [Cyanobacteria bacterium DS2.3.42]
MPNTVDAASSRPAELTTYVQSQQFATFSDNELTGPSLRNDWVAINASKRENQTDLPTLTIDEFVNESERVARKIDLDKNSWISAKELSMAVDNPYITGQDAQVVAGIYRLNDVSKEKHPDKKYFPMQNIDARHIKDDLRALIDVGTSANNSDKELDWIKSEKLDTNGDQIVDQKELTQARNSDPSTEMLIATKFFYREQQHAIREGREFPGLTDESLVKLNRVIGESNIPAEKIVKEAMERTASAQRQSRSTEVFADKENPLNSIKPDAVHQGALGNCYFESVVAGVAQQRPELIRDMIEDVGHGVYKVTFPGDKNLPVYVTAPSDVNIGIFNKGSENGVWPNILEKAYGKYKSLKSGTFDKTVGDAKGTDGGGFASDIIPLFTGNDAQAEVRNNHLFERNKNNDMYIQHKAERVVDELNEGNIVTVSTGATDEAKIFGIPDHHALTVLSSHEKDGKTYFTVRDPWSSDSKSRNNKNGVFELEAKEFLQAFEAITYERRDQT